MRHRIIWEMLSLMLGMEQKAHFSKSPLQRRDYEPRPSKAERKKEKRQKKDEAALRAHQSHQTPR